MLVLDKLQSFLPQVAQANESLRQQMDEAPAAFFDIESVEDAEKIIAIVRLVSPLAVIHLNASKYNNISLIP